GTARPATSSLSLHDALPICHGAEQRRRRGQRRDRVARDIRQHGPDALLMRGQHLQPPHKKVEEAVTSGIALRAAAAVAEYGLVRSEEHTSELQSRENRVCRP